MIVTEKGTFGFSPVINFKLILTLPVFRPCTNPFQTNTVTTLVAFIKKKICIQVPPIGTPTPLWLKGISQ